MMTSDVKYVKNIDLNTLLFLSFFFSSRRRHTRCLSDWSSDVCSSDLAAVAPAAPPTAEAGARALSGNAARIAALVIGLAGIGAVAIRNALSAEPDVGSAVLIALAVGIIGLRLVHSTRADRRYATLLENEVASQTRSLMDSLAATASAE